MTKKKPTKAKPKDEKKSKPDRPEGAWTTKKAAEELFPKGALDAVRRDLDSVRPKFDDPIEGA